MTPSKRYIIIPSGGSGVRMGRPIPKQYIEIGGRPILSYTLEATAPFVDHLVIAVQSDYIDLCQKIVADLHLTHKVSVVEGGTTRFLSVKNALASLPCEGLIGIHDAVRPWVSQQTIRQCFEKAEMYGAAIPVVPLIESIRQGDQHSNHAVDRYHYRLVRTPQVFRAERIQKAYDTEDSTLFTDDCSVYERLYQDVQWVEDSYRNIKITTADDLLFFHTSLPE